MATTSNLPFTAALLMGGRSRRMGRDKAELELEGVPLWRRQLQVLEQTGAAEVVISATADRIGRTGKYPVVVDEVEGQGPLRALATLLRRGANPGLLVLGVDLPAMSAEFLKRLAAAARAEDCALIPDDGTRLQPLAACYTSRCLPLIDEQLARGAFAIHRFVETAIESGVARRLLLEPEQVPLFVNLNSPEDLAEYLRRHAH